MCVCVYMCMYVCVCLWNYASVSRHQMPCSSRSIPGTRVDILRLYFCTLLYPFANNGRTRKMSRRRSKDVWEKGDRDTPSSLSPLLFWHPKSLARRWLATARAVHDVPKKPTAADASNLPFSGNLRKILSDMSSKLLPSLTP